MTTSSATNDEEIISLLKEKKCTVSECTTQEKKKEDQSTAIVQNRRGAALMVVAFLLCSCYYVLVSIWKRQQQNVASSSSGVIGLATNSTIRKFNIANLTTITELNSSLHEKRDDEITLQRNNSTVDDTVSSVSIAFKCPKRASAMPREVYNNFYYVNTPSDTAVDTPNSSTALLQLDGISQRQYDMYGHTFHEMKQESKRHLETYNVEKITKLRNGHVYELSCDPFGYGMYMTKAILHEILAHQQLKKKKSTENSISSAKHSVHMYGNAVDSNINTNDRMRTIVTAPNGETVGVLCDWPNSANLSHVPSDTFDIVHTHYLAPLMDPLAVHDTTMSDDAEINRNYTSYCEQRNTYKSEKAQIVQNNWYELYVQEMIRITKPGGIILIQHISNPLCDAMYDWGGVSPNFWNTIIAVQNNITNLQFLNDELFVLQKRYHVAMTKAKR